MHSRRPGFLLSFLLLAVVLQASYLAASPPQRPDIFLILADDQTWSDSGAYGNEEVRTPHIDRLARDGMRFDLAFTATAMCAPTRQQLYTGLFPVKNGAYPNHSRVKSGTRSLVHHFSALGYRVGLVGKQHFGPPDSFPFERVSRARMTEFISRDASQPWFLVYASNSPHLPWSEGDASAYDSASFKIPPYLVDTPETRAARARYYAEITDFDRELGECDRAIATHGRPKDTIFIYSSEQGAQFPHGKWTCYDTGLHVGLIVRWPARVRAGTSNRAMVQYVDIVPTLLDAVGAKPPAGLDGKSFLSVLEGHSTEHAKHVFGVHTTRGIIAGSECYPIRSIRSKSHKLIWNLNSKTQFRNILSTGRDKSGYWKSWLEKAKTSARAARIVSNYCDRPEFELYDLRKDPLELRNLASSDSSPELAAIQAGLLLKLKSWMKAQGDLGIETEMAAKSRKNNKKTSTTKERPTKRKNQP